MRKDYRHGLKTLQRSAEHRSSSPEIGSIGEAAPNYEIWLKVMYGTE